MERRLFKTLIKGDHILSGQSYVKGKISGIELCTCGQGSRKQYNIKEGIINLIECTSEEYEKFRFYVEGLYPGLCEFDYKEESE